MSLSTWSLSAIIAIGTTVGTLLGLILKEFLFPWGLELLKERRAVRAVFRRYRDPILLAALELTNRLDEILTDYPTDYLAASTLAGTRPARIYTAAVGASYLRYKCESTLYRFCGVLGWLELYRQEVVFLRSGVRSIDANLGVAVKRLRTILADGRLNHAENWQEWKDALVMREEQRAIGESMIVAGPQGREVMSYGQFVAKRLGAAGGDEWIAAAGHFLFDLQKQRDFRHERLKYFTSALIDLIEALSDAPLSQRHEALRRTVNSPASDVDEELALL